MTILGCVAQVLVEGKTKLVEGKIELALYFRCYYKHSNTLYMPQKSILYGCNNSRYGSTVTIECALFS